MEYHNTTNALDIEHFNIYCLVGVNNLDSWLKIQIKSSNYEDLMGYHFTKVFSPGKLHVNKICTYVRNPKHRTLRFLLSVNTT